MESDWFRNLFRILVNFICICWEPLPSHPSMNVSSVCMSACLFRLCLPRSRVSCTGLATQTVLQCLCSLVWWRESRKHSSQNGGFGKRIYLKPPSYRKDLGTSIAQCLPAQQETVAQSEDQASPWAGAGDRNRGQLCRGPSGPCTPLLERPHPGFAGCC